MNWHDIAFPTDASLECRHSAEMLGMEDVYEQDTDIFREWKEIDELPAVDHYECMTSEYLLYDHEQECVMALDDDTILDMEHDYVYVSNDGDSEFTDAWDEEWFWTQRSLHINTLAAEKQRLWEKTHTRRPKFTRPTISIIKPPEPVVVVVATTTKEVEPEPVLNLPKYNPKETFTFKTGVVIKMNYTDGEMMHRNGVYRKAFNSRQTADFLERGFQFDHKHEVLYKPQ